MNFIQLRIIGLVFMAFSSYASLANIKKGNTTLIISKNVSEITTHVHIVLAKLPTKWFQNEKATSITFKTRNADNDCSQDGWAHRKQSGTLYNFKSEGKYIIEMNLECLKSIEEKALEKEASLHGKKQSFQVLVTREILHGLAHFVDIHNNFSAAPQFLHSIGMWFPEIPSFIPLTDNARKYLHSRFAMQSGEIRDSAIKSGSEKEQKEYSQDVQEILDGPKNAIEVFSEMVTEYYAPLVFNGQDKKKHHNLKCRFPTSFRYLKKISSNSAYKFDDIECTTPLMKKVKGLEKPQAEILLVEAPSNALDSIKGHVFLRVGTRKGNDQEKAMVHSQDLVFSFRPTEESKKSKAKKFAKATFGLTPTAFSVSTFADFIHRYTYIEDRSVKRYKLNITKNNLYHIIERMQEFSTLQKEGYKFLTSNGGSLLAREIGHAIGDKELFSAATEGKFFRPPQRTLGLMKRKGLITEIQPGFQSSSLKKVHSQTRMYALLKRLNIELSITSDFSVKSDVKRLESYQYILKKWRKKKALKAKEAMLIHEFLLRAYDIERYYSFTLSKEETKSLNPKTTHFLEKSINQVTAKFDLNADITLLELDKRDKAFFSSLEYKLGNINRHRSAFTPTAPVVISSSFIVHENDFEHIITHKSSWYTEDFGDRSDFNMGPNLRLNVFDGSLAINPRRFRVEQSHFTLLSLDKLNHQKDDTRRIRSVFISPVSALGGGLEILSNSGQATLGVNNSLKFLTLRGTMALLADRHLKNYLLASAQASPQWESLKTSTNDLNSFGAHFQGNIEGKLQLSEFGLLRSKASMHYFIPIDAPMRSGLTSETSLEINAGENSSGAYYLIIGHRYQGLFDYPNQEKALREINEFGAGILIRGL